MLAGHVVHGDACAADHLIGVVELRRLGKMGDVAGMEHKRRLLRKRLDAVDGLSERIDGVRIGGLVKAHVAVGDLQKCESRSGHLGCRRAVEQPERLRHAGAHRPQNTGSSPNHAFEGMPAADAAVVMIVMCHSFSLSKSPEFGASERENSWTGQFIPVAKTLTGNCERWAAPTSSAQHAGATANVKLTFQPRAHAYFGA